MDSYNSMEGIQRKSCRNLGDTAKMLSVYCQHIGSFAVTCRVILKLPEGLLKADRRTEHISQLV